VIIRASAPGKAVILGEYAVLTGAEALVMAVDRRCHVTLEPASRDGRCRLEIRAPLATVVEFAPGASSGNALVDCVTAALGTGRLAGPWHAALDSSAFFAGGTKLGLGSSAAVLTAFAAAWAAAAGVAADRNNVNSLIELHRSFQRGTGSGLDVAAAVQGGVLSFRLMGGAAPSIGSVQLPNSVGFACIFTGNSAATPDFVERFAAWRKAEPGAARALLDVLESLAREGCLAARRNDAAAFLTAVGEYGVQLERLGAAIGRAIVTREHGEIGMLAREYGVTYKVSGAGGGDLGLAFSSDAEALGAFGRAIRATRYRWIDLKADPAGLVVEEQNE